MQYHEQKQDYGKAPVWRGLINYFPRALLAVAQVSAMGNRKYKEWGGWATVEDALDRYRDAEGRHMLESAMHEMDGESQLLVAAHTAWNALAVLELRLREYEKAAADALAASVE